MPTELCKYGFSCAAMMMQQGLTAIDCPNRQTCGTIVHLTEEETVALQQARRERNYLYLETVLMNSTQTADRLLTDRGCPQTPTSLGVTEAIERLRETISLLEETIQELSVGYIAPVGVEAHRYSVTRPSGVYEYNKLTAKQAIFPPQIRENPVKVVHLSKDYDPRNIKGRAGIERRNKLLAISTQIRLATNILNAAREKAEVSRVDRN